MADLLHAAHGHATIAGVRQQYPPNVAVDFTQLRVRDPTAFATQEHGEKNCAFRMSMRMSVALFPSACLAPDSTHGLLRGLLALTVHPVEGWRHECRPTS